MFRINFPVLAPQLYVCGENYSMFPLNSNILNHTWYARSTWYPGEVIEDSIVISSVLRLRSDCMPFWGYNPR